MTNITEELARLNGLDAKRKRGEISIDSYQPDAIALLNTMHGLLVQAKGALREGVHYTTLREDYQDESNFRQLADENLTALRDAGIGGAK